MHDWKAYVRRHLPSLGCPPEREADIVEEIALQLEGVYRTARASGASDAEALARAADEIPDWPALAAAVMASRYPRTAPIRGITHARLEPFVARQPFGSRLLTIATELRHAARSLAASPVFTLAATLTLAIGLGATTAVFSLVDGVLLEPLPFRDPSRLVIVQETIPELAERYPVLGANPRSFAAWTRGCRTCDGLAALATTTGTLTGSGEPEGLVGARISPNFFEVLGLRFAAGRAFTPDEDRPGADAVVVLAHALWVRRFNADPSIVGRTIEIDGRAMQVAGVLAPAPDFPHLEHLTVVGGFVLGAPEFYRPLAWPPDLLRSAGEYDNVAIVRLAAGATPARLQSELDAITEADFRSEAIHPQTRVRPLADHWLGPARRPLSLLLASVVAALVIACVNVANLMGGRWVGRRRELAVRLAMGARFRDLLRLVAAEGALVATAGGAAGLLVAFAGFQALVRLAPAGTPRLESVGLDTSALAFGLAATLFCALVCSLVPAWHAFRGDAAEALKAGSHSTTDSPRWRLVRSWLVGGEVAVTSALLIVGGLLLVSFQNVLRVKPGFETDGVLAVDLKLPGARYPDAASRARFLDALVRDVRAVPGVEQAGIVRVLPLEGEATVDAIVAAGDPRPITAHPVGSHLQVSPGYFRALGFALVAGRWLEDADRRRNVALVSERTARAVWQDQNPVGRRFTRSNRQQEWEVVGVVADVRRLGLERDPGLTVYVPYWGTGTASEFTLAVRTSGDPASALGGVRDVVARLDRQLPLQRIRTMDAVLESTLANRRFQIRLMAAFGSAGLLLACLGVYAVVVSAVERRTPEFAIRLALGATPGVIARAVLGQGLRSVVTGLIVGIGGGMVAARSIASLLFGVSPYDAGVVAAVAGVMIGVGIAACLSPAARATRTDALIALRHS
jgi:putative ABC transport system permease protein